MNYGFLFAIVAVMLCVTAATRGAWYWGCLWPGVAFAGVSLAYFTGNPRIFGKRPDGTLARPNVLLLMPVLFVLTIVYHLARLFSRGPAFQVLAEDVIIGRRLLSHELPGSVNAVIDLTSEFAEPARLRATGYHSFPVLDASVPTEPKLAEWLRKSDGIAGVIYIHCAQGYGRTALFASLLLLHRGVAVTADDALRKIQACRPLARLNSAQRRFLNDVASRISRKPDSTA